MANVNQLTHKASVEAFTQVMFKVKFVAHRSYALLCGAFRMNPIHTFIASKTK